MLDGLDRLSPNHVLCGHLPVARGIETLSAVIRTAYDRGTTEAVTPDDVIRAEAALA